MDNSHLTVLGDLVIDTGATPELFDPNGKEIEDPFFDSAVAVRRVFEAIYKISEERVHKLASRAI